MRTLAFNVPGQPVSWQVFSRWDTSDAKRHLKAYQDAIRVAAREAMQGLPPHAGRIDLELWFYRQIPPTAGKRQATRDRWVEMHMLLPPDLTNYQKACEDALAEARQKGVAKELMGIVFIDDGQVTDLRSHKRFAEDAHTSIMVKFLEIMDGMDDEMDSLSDQLADSQEQVAKLRAAEVLASVLAAIMEDCRGDIESVSRGLEAAADAALAAWLAAWKEE